MDADSRVQVTLFGGLRVHLPGREVGDRDWPGRRPAELVALLALAERHTLLRDQVLEALWPHLAPEAAAANLRKAAHHARQTLGCEDAVTLSGGRVHLFPGREVRTDLATFEHAVGPTLKSADPAACAQLAATAGAELLPEFGYEDWAQDRRAIVTRRRVDLLRVGAEWEQVVAADPGDEEAFRELMRRSLARGNRHEAIRWFGRMRSGLERELGLRPGPESLELYHRCIVDLLPAEQPFIGRTLELAHAEAAMSGAAAGGSFLLAIRGEAGIGKSTLAHQIGAVAREHGWRSVSAAAAVGCGAYAPLAEIVGHLVGADRTILNGMTEQVRSTLAQMSPMAEPAPDPPAGLSRHMVIGGVHHVLMSAAGSGMVLTIDDLHLADDGTIEACLQLARARGPRPLLVVVAYRPEAARPVLAQGVAELHRARRAHALELGPMSEDEIAQLLAGRVEAEQAAQVAANSGGNPFFALELAHSGGAATATTSDGAAVVPPSVWEAVTARFVDLDGLSLGMLQRLAVAGEALDVAGVLAMTGLPEPDAFAFLDAALAAGVLQVAGTQYRFRHDLLRTALAEQVAPHHRLALHRDAARRLGDYGAEPALIAQHWLLGERPAEAEAWLLAAARRAVGLGAYAEALRHLDIAVDNGSSDPDLLCVRAEVLDALGDARAPEAYALAAEAADEQAAHEIRAKQALAQVKRGDPPGALRTLDGIEPVTVPGRLAEALAWAGAAVLGYATPETGTAKAAESRRLALQTGDHATLVIASWAQAAAAHARGDLRASVWNDLLDTASLPDLAINVFDGHLCISQRLLYGHRPYPDVIAFADAFEAEATRLGAERGRAYAITLRGEAKLLSGQLAAADVDLRQAAELSRGLGGAVGEALALHRRAELALLRERAPQAHALLDEALAVARDSDVGFHLLDRIYGARIQAAADPDAALTVLADADACVRGPLETCPGCRIMLAVPAAIAAARGGDVDAAASWADAVDFLADVVMKLPAWYAARAEVRGHLALAKGEPAQAHFAEATRGFEDTGQPLDAARCRRLLAG